MEEYGVVLENLHVKYKELKKFSIKQNLFKLKKVEHEEHEAVKGVDLKVRKGEILGIIGKNGCGKSTMLKTIAGIFSPDQGKVELFGQSVSLLAIGVGFQPHLTGRENIYLSGMLMGFNEKQVKEKEEEIIAFADIGKFIDKPVRSYSSGMYSKLAFAISAILETDIVLIDEVLSVGDQTFKKKSYLKMKQLIENENRTVLIVSHNISALMKLCNRVLWMHEGQIVEIGDPKEVLDHYTEFMEK